jgi:hypothetical protein
MRLQVGARDGVQQGAGVRHPDVAEQVSGRGPLDYPARVHHHDLLGVGRGEGEVMADHQQRGAKLLLQVQQEIHDLSLGRDVERGRRLVGDQQRGLAGQGDGDDHALAHATGELVRVFVESPFRRGEAHRPEQLDGAIMGILPVDRQVAPDRLGDLRADPHRRVQRPLRVLEDHRGVAAPMLLQFLLAAADELHALEPDRAGNVGRARQQAHDRIRADGLAGTGLADDGQRLAGFDGEADTLHRVHDGAPRAEAYPQVADVKQGPRLSGRWRWLVARRARCGHGRRRQPAKSLPERAGHQRTPQRARRPSPMRFSETTVTMRKMLGTMT